MCQAFEVIQDGVRKVQDYRGYKDQRYEVLKSLEFIWVRDYRGIGVPKIRDIRDLKVQNLYGLDLTGVGCYGILIMDYIS